MPSKKTGRKSPAESVRALKAEVSQKVLELTEANRRLRRKIFDLYTIFELSRNFNAVLNYETLLDSLVLTSMGQMGAAKAALYLPLHIGRKEFQLARVKGSAPFPEKEIIIDPDGQFGRYITALNRPVHIEDLAGKFVEADGIDFIKYFPSGLIIPLIFQTKLRGILIISVKLTDRQYLDDDIEFLSILANQTAVSIENARLYESESEALNKLQKTQELLLQTERLAALGELSAKIAHEVNNPLGIIKNYLLLLQRNTDGDSSNAENIKIIGHEIDRIATIVKQLLDIHRPRIVKFAEVDLRHVLDEVIVLMRRQLNESGIDVEMNIPGNVPLIMAWSDGLKQVFLNLFINAREAMKSGGKVIISVTVEKFLIKIKFKDTGPGVEKKHIPHIFEPFYTTKESSGGSGLGLSVCYGIIKNHGGSIEYCNAEPGSCFEIKLPIAQKEVNYDWRI